MKIAYTREYTLQFNVEYFEGSEGGMNSECFGDRSPETLEAAVDLWEKANTMRPNEDWIITCEPSVILKASK